MAVCCSNHQILIIISLLVLHMVNSAYSSVVKQKVEVGLSQASDKAGENLYGNSTANDGEAIEKVFGAEFLNAFVKAILVIIVSEIGDKTFFIAAIFAMKHARSTVFIGAISALGLMTFLSVVLGYATTVIPRSVTFYASVGLFVVFGMKMLHEGYTMKPEEAQEELEEVTAELKIKDEEMEQLRSRDVESGGQIPTLTYKQRILSMFSPILIQSFTLTFLAEWGDRSQITTIVLAASENAYGVFAGAVIGHALCTGFAVIGGRMIAQRISVRTVTIIGGVFFVCNAIYSLITGPIS